MILAFCNSITLLFFSKCITAPNDLKNSLETLICQTYSLLYEQQFGTKNNLPSIGWTGRFNHLFFWVISTITVYVCLCITTWVHLSRNTIRLYGNNCRYTFQRKRHLLCTVTYPEIPSNGQNCLLKYFQNQLL